MIADTLARKAGDSILVPTWVPPDFRALYRLVAVRRGEEDAAALARTLKAADGESGWTLSRLTILLRMWLDGSTMAAIAEAIGGVTRNAVIGKLHRIGLTDDLRKAQGIDGPKPKPAVVKRAAPTLRVVAKPKPKPAPPPAVSPPQLRVVEPAPAPAGGVGIFELELHHCRWIMAGAGADARYCGAKRVADAPRWLCEAHQVAAADTSGRRRG